MAHFGGAFAGALYGLMLRRGVDITRPFNNALDSIANMFYAIKEFKDLAEVGVDHILNVLSNFGVSNLNTLIDTIGGSDILTTNVDKINEIHSFILGINI